MNQRIRQSVLLLDLLWVSAAFTFAYALRYKYLGFGIDSWASFRDFLPALCSALIIWTFLYLSKSLEGFRGGWHLPTVFSQIVVAVFYLMAFLLALAFLQRHYYSRLLLLYLACLLPIGLITVRCLIRWIIASRSWSGATRRAVILGTGHLAQELAYKISRHPEMLLDVVGFLYPSSSEASNGSAIPNEELVPLQSLNVHSLLSEKGVQELIVVMPQPAGSDAEKIISKCRTAGMRVRLVPNWYELYISDAQMVEVDGVPLISLEERNISAVALGLKRAVDLLGGALLLVLSLPALFVSLVSLKRRKGRALVTELRCGRLGVAFPMFRLNVNRENPGPHRFDKVLVRLSLTELPQLWNVLRGEMSLVGPRPESAERVRHYSDWQRQRLCVNPGLTGMAQVHGLREQHSSEEKARFDLEYIFHWSLFLDFSLMLQTAWTLAVRFLHSPRIKPSLALGLPKPIDMGTIKEVLRVDSTQSGAD
jgi:lipopolysaccharide/colanic/teichoic acid biosynthesis glycosyltransferase